MPNGFNNRPPLGQSILDNVIGGNLSGIISARPTAKYASGARCTLKINGKVVGFAFAVSWRINTTYTEINTLDDPLPNELIPQRLTVEGSISSLHIPGTSATTESWQPDVLSFLFHKYVSIEVRDSQTDALLFLTNKAVITSRQEEIRVDQLANVTLTWKAIGFQDEKPPETPAGVNDRSAPKTSNPDTTIKVPGTNLTLPKFNPGAEIKKLFP